jgi:proline dehydrogenase
LRRPIEEWLRYCDWDRATGRIRQLEVQMLRAALIRASGSPFLKRQMSVNPIARRVAARFIAGNTLDDAEAAVRALNAGGAAVALDFLGENTTSTTQAIQSTDSYLAALDRIEQAGLDANVSVKLTAMGLDLDPEFAAEQAARVVGRAKAVGAMVGVDMESHTYVEPTLAMVDRLRHLTGREGIGVCLQSYLYRTPDDLAAVNAWEVPIRLVKGAYKEPPEVAHQARARVDEAYGRLLEPLLEANPYPMVATHDPRLVARAKAVAGRLGRDRDTFEFQMLYGVARELQRRIVAEGYRLRVYVPYGDEWYPYFMRRLAERPANLAFFLSSLVRR